jgi:hypothetical protein
MEIRHKFLFILCIFKNLDRCFESANTKQMFFLKKD